MHRRRLGGDEVDHILRRAVPQPNLIAVADDVDLLVGGLDQRQVLRLGAEPQVEVVVARQEGEGVEAIATALAGGSCSRDDRSDRPRLAVHVRAPLSLGVLAVAMAATSCWAVCAGRLGGADAPLKVGTNAPSPTAASTAAGTAYLALFHRM